MADKKKFEKPQMEVITLNTKVGLMNSSGCPSNYCSPDYDCMTYGS